MAKPLLLAMKTQPATVGRLCLYNATKACNAQSSSSSSPFVYGTNCKVTCCIYWNTNHGKRKGAKYISISTNNMQNVRISLKLHYQIIHTNTTNIKTH